MKPEALNLTPPVNLVEARRQLTLADEALDRALTRQREAAQAMVMATDAWHEDQGEKWLKFANDTTEMALNDLAIARRERNSLQRELDRIVGA
jgi:hypothetical protein